MVSGDRSRVVDEFVDEPGGAGAVGRPGSGAEEVRDVLVAHGATVDDDGDVGC
jgi:hypothetical protein